MMRANLEQIALFTLRPVRLMKGPRHRAPQLIEMKRTILSAAEQVHLHYRLPHFQLQGSWHAFEKVSSAQE
ncbi:hypothetical protein WL1483_2553 [Aeromonas schubertii]|uniref:Uncharacterized protein n=1 Tax=Aeromonas schubertii TaxID=652 RepID=A0A0S2SJU2_9GAMM|nr:hypothetical protein WL1483_2553 [Aeromonas schubertii]